MESSAISFEVIFCDDFSTDHSRKVIESITQTDYRIRAVFNKSNLGLPYNALNGISQTTGRYIVTIDDDLEYNPHDILILYSKLISGNAKVVFGLSPAKYIVQGKSDSFARWRNGVLNTLWRKPVTDSFKIFRRELVFTDLDFIPRIHFEGFIARRLKNTDIEYVEISYHPRFEGVSNYGFFKKLRLFWQMTRGFLFNR